MIVISQIALVVFFMKGIMMLADVLMGVPPGSTAKAYRKNIKKKVTFQTIWREKVLSPLSAACGIFIKLSEEKEAELLRRLERVEISLSPKEYYGRIIAVEILLLPILTFSFMLGSFLLICVTVLLMALAGYNSLIDIKTQEKKKKEAIENELPEFVRSIIYKLNENQDDVVKADLISIFEDYLKVSNEIFRYDVSVLIMEMKSIETETALRNFNNRLGITEVSFLCNALIGLTRGEPQNATLDSLARDMDIKAKENIRKELNKRPKKVMLMSVPLIGLTFITIAYVIVVHLLSSMRLF